MSVHLAAHRGRIVFALHAWGDLATVRRKLAAVTKCLLLHAHLINHTLRNPLVLLTRLGGTITFLPIWWRFRSLVGCGSSICVLDHCASFLSTVDEDMYRSRHQDFIFSAYLVRDLNDFDGATIALVCDLTTLSPRLFSLLTRALLMLFRTGLELLLFLRFELLLLLLRFFLATKGPLEVRFTHSHVRSNISGHSGAALSLNLSLGVQVFNRVMSNRAMTHSEVCLCTMGST